ncbi:MAG: ABC transporter permease [Bacteroidia bacterium]|nr:ABC transporter permease [Bacteroidia bacterium]
MKSLANLIRWDLTVQSRYQILTVLMGITSIYLLLFWLVPEIRYMELLILIIFSDPALLGLTFIGALVLFEKGERTLDAMVVTPIKDWQYIWSKAISLTISSTVVAILLALAGHGLDLNYLTFVSNLILTSLLYVLLGFILVSRSESLNEYVIKLAVILLPISLPLLNLFGLTDSLILYLIPSQASLLLFQGAFGEEIQIWEYFYSYGYLLISIAVMYFFARRAYHNHIVQ